MALCVKRIESNASIHIKSTLGRLLMLFFMKMTKSIDIKLIIVLQCIYIYT